MTREEVYQVINEERDYQDIRWGGQEHDKHHAPHAFALFMQHYMTKAIAGFTKGDYWDEGMKELRKVVALGVACFEQHGVPRRHTVAPMTRL